MERWVNKVAVVTGASAGIGEACTRALLEHGMIVVGLARRQMFMDRELRASFPEDQRERFHAIKCDVRIESDIRAAFAWIDENLGGVDVLINNAGMVRHSIKLLSGNSAAGIEVNVVGVALCTREAFQSMKRRNVDDGCIILLSSLAGHVPGLRCNAHSSARFALTAMVEVLRSEFSQQRTKIKITTISPASFDTKSADDTSSLNKELATLQCKDVADAVIYCIQTPRNAHISEIIMEPWHENF